MLYLVISVDTLIQINLQVKNNFFQGIKNTQSTQEMLNQFKSI